MLIGLLSDTHDNIPNIKQAIKRFKEEQVKLVLHAGDYVSIFTSYPYAELDVPLIGVFGNNCAMTEGLKDAYRKVGGDIRGYFTEVEADGLRIALLHGHRKQDIDRANSGEYDVIVQGHSHESSISEEKGILVVNPGEVCGYAHMLGLVQNTSSIGFLDTERKQAWISQLI
ncbi:MAG: metallophosphoesterase [Promethearchaeota archaeon]|jgi:putative phosphoesterase